MRRPLAFFLFSGATACGVATSDEPPLAPAPEQPDVPLIETAAPAVAPRVISVGHMHAAALDDAGHALCWGRGLAWNTEQPLEAAMHPTPCGRSDVRYTAIAAGDTRTCAIAASPRGRIDCWGTGASSLVVSEQETPGVATAVAVGDFSSCAIFEGGSVECWGSPAPRLDEPALELAMNGRLACARLASGAVSCWGNDEKHGAIDGSARVVGAKAIAVGFNHVCAIAAGGDRDRIVCWGGNYYGQLGDGTSEDRHAPVSVVDDVLDRPVAVVAGVNTTCALDVTGRVACWGWNSTGQIGDGARAVPTQAKPGPLAPSGADRVTPVVVRGLSRAVTKISLGGYTAHATLSNGAVVGWGLNNLGQVGDGSKTDRTTPVVVRFP